MPVEELLKTNVNEPKSPEFAVAIGTASSSGIDDGVCVRHAMAELGQSCPHDWQEVLKSTGYGENKILLVSYNIST